MIYALCNPGITPAERLEVATAIQNRNHAVITDYVNQGKIVHIRDVASQSKLRCIFCEDRVARVNLPRSCRPECRGPVAFSARDGT